MAFHFLHEEGRCVAGIEFSSKTLLRIGVGLLGARITLAQIFDLGIGPVLPAKSEGRFGKKHFAYLPKEDAYRYPAEERLPYRYTNEEDGKMPRRYWTTACPTSAHVLVFGRRQRQDAPQAQLAGVQKAPRHEVAGSVAPGRATSTMRLACRRRSRW